MSTHWMKQTLIASVLSVLMTLQATTQQCRLSGPALPPSATPEKLEVPPKLQPLVQRAIRATLQLQDARLELLRVVKQLEAQAKNSEMFGNRTEVMRTEQGKAKNKFQKDAGGIINVNGVLNKIQEGIFQAVANPAFLRFVRKGRTSEAGVNIVKKQGFIESDGTPEHPRFLEAGGAKDSANGMAIVNITDLENSIVEVQKAIQSPPISMEGNKLNFRPARPLP